MKKNRVLIIVIAGIIAFLTLSGYRLTAESAAKAHAFLEKDAQKIEEIDFNWGKAYIYKIDDYYRTVTVIRSGFLWRSPASVSLESVDDKKDDIRTIGWESFSNKKKSITILAIKSNDKSVAYVEAGPERDRVRKEISPKDIVIFSWDKPFYTHDIEPIALSKDNEKLYRYGYPDGTNVFRNEDLKWYKVK